MEEIDRDSALGNDLSVIAGINVHFHLSEPLRVTAQRRWWDILAFQLAMYYEREFVEKARREEALKHD